jgi:peptidoglycan/xylan/chitin deacetylase (PgdA/CDA1 family)
MAYNLIQRPTMRQFEPKRTAKVAISLIYYLAVSFIALFYRIIGRSLKKRLTILYYHGISPEVRIAFAQQMEALAKSARVVPASYRGSIPADKAAVAITFDDAFVSVLQNAVPEMVSRSLCCTIFVPVAVLGQHPTWTVEADSRERDEVVMTARQLKTLPAEHVVLGSHSMSHPHLSQLHSEKARAEIEQSRRILAELTSREARLFAFPYGDHNSEVIELCKRAGYEFVFTISPTPVDTEGPQFARGRIKVEPLDGTLEFFLKSRGAYAWMSYVSRAKQKLFGPRSP